MSNSKEKEGEEEVIQFSDASDWWPNKMEIVPQTVFPSSCPQCNYSVNDEDTVKTVNFIDGKTIVGEKKEGYTCPKCKTKWVKSTGCTMRDEEIETFGGPRHAQN